MNVYRFDKVVSSQEVANWYWCKLETNPCLMQKGTCASCKGRALGLGSSSVSRFGCSEIFDFNLVLLKLRLQKKKIVIFCHERKPDSLITTSMHNPSKASKRSPSKNCFFHHFHPFPRSRSPPDSGIRTPISSICCSLSQALSPNVR